MVTILSQKNNNSTFFVFLLSIIFHIGIFLAFIFCLPKANFEKQNTNIIYMQFQASPNNKKETQKPKELPKKTLTKKLIQRDPTSAKPSARVQQQPQIESQNNLKTQTSTNQEENRTQPVIEAVVDKAARCQIPEIPITQDAANAGITSGKVILEVQISSTGKVTQANLLKGTGFQIDNEVIQFAKEMQCTPAEKDGKNVAVIKRLQWMIIR